MSTINYYATYVMGSASAVTPILAVFLATAIITTILAAPIDRKFVRRNTMILSAILYMLGKVWFVRNPYSMGAIYVNGITVAVSMNLAFVLFNTNRNNIADLIDWNNGRPAAGYIRRFPMPEITYSPEFLDLCAAKLGAMVQIPTVSRAENEDLTEFFRFHKVLEEQFPLLHTKLEKTVLNGTLLYRWPGSDANRRPILLMGHQDVVPASDEGWTVPAYSGKVVDGNLYGRGSLDCKSTMFVEMEAVEQLLAEGFTPVCDVWLEFSINEETGGDGAAAAMRYLRDKGLRFAMVMDEGGAVMDEAVPGMDRPYAMIGITEKGYMDVKITARGKGGHSSTPPRNTPAARLFAFANEIEKKRPFEKKLLSEVEEMFRCMAPSMPVHLGFVLKNVKLLKPLIMALMPKISPFGEAVMATTCCFTMMQGSGAPNVIPKEPWLIANLRTSVHQNCEASLAVLKQYADKYDLELEVLMQRDASPVSNIHSQEYGYLVDCIHRHFPDAGTAPYVIMGGTDCRHFHALTENALRFCPVRMTNAQSASCHAVDENVTVSALAEGVEFFKMFLKGYDL